MQPLRPTQIQDALQKAGPSFLGVRKAFEQREDLRELASTPLTLSVLLLTYQGASASDIVGQSTDLEQQAWTEYVARMVAEKGSVTHYPLERTCAWLSFLARQMQIHHTPVFSAEYLQTDWLEADQQRSVAWLFTRIPAIVLGACASLLVWGLLGLSFFSTVDLLQVGVIGGFAGGCLSRERSAGSAAHPSTSPTSKWTLVSNSMLAAMIIAASCGLSLGGDYLVTQSYTMSDWLRDGSILGLGSGLSLWIFQVLLHRRSSPQPRTRSMSAFRRGRLVRWFNRVAPSHVWQAALSLGVGMGLGVGLIDGPVLLLTGALLMWTVSGGVTVLRHYVICWLLAHQRSFPWRARAFLDDVATRILLRRVGGGYSFIHRRLQDYFAGVMVPPPQK
ncbi:hypothetical protein KSF_102200 [Reticulibacter mediterranei]|uniref:Uncharacterized protein n=1 Tax=Reticulibacter mediterranei TaxID=2778369 RepID=A0A8J3NAA3_9CHLR|nr:hypothetical protein [Reticulibacter mediterranei]GHP00173.1 hypothetical protein KSF_102200 [Reticulibacter mediterranei]